MTDLDILIPHFRDPEGLRSTLSSLGQQTWQGAKRVVVVDDGSDSLSFEMVEKIMVDAGLNSTLVRNETNQGRPATRNRLLKLIESPYVAWLDAGDTWYPEKLARQFERIAEVKTEGLSLDSTWVTCDYDWRWSGKEATPTIQYLEGDQLREILLGKKLRAYLWSTLMPTASLSRVGCFDERLPRLQDLDFFVRFLSAGGRLVKPRLNEPSPLCVYEKTDVGRDAAQIRACNARIFRKHRPLYDAYGRGFVQETLVKADLHSARFAKNNGDYWGFGYYVAKAVARGPARAFLALGRKALGR
jgi:glycosyltransferase involved in cell wall biosynthesis